MAMQQAKITVTGINPLVFNNPQTVDRFNRYAQAIAKINAKGKSRTDDDYRELRELEIESKVYFDDKLGVYAPSSWLMEAIASNGFKVAKLSRDTIRGSLFVTENKLPLKYDNSNKVKGIKDIVKNSEFHHVANVPQQKVRVMKAFPMFNNWSFTACVEFDDKMIDPNSLTNIVAHAAKYGGFGDWRPTFGRALAEVEHV